MNVLGLPFAAPFARTVLQRAGTAVIARIVECLIPPIGKSYDFSIHNPQCCLSPQVRKWKGIQAGFESLSFRLRHENELSFYEKQIDSVKEIYQEEFNISGTILDVGGEQGSLKHFVDMDAPATNYCCIDPFVKLFEQDGPLPSNYVLAYPCLREPLNFVGGIAERLPFKSKTFDYVHMRSVLDHLHDPYMAMREVYRVLKPNGKLLIGLSVTGGESSLGDRGKISRLRKKLRDQGLCKTAKRVIVESLKLLSRHKGETDHMFYWSYDGLVDLVGATGLTIEKVHWQKRPYDHCVYMLSQKKVNN